MKNKTILIAVALLAGLSDGKTVLDLDFNDQAIGTTILSGSGTLDYNRAAAWDGSQAENTLGMMIGSSSSIYKIKDGGAGHDSVLYNSGGSNISLDQMGIYFGKLDMTAEGANASQVVRVSWSFDIIGATDDADFVQTGWEVRINSTNTANNVSLDGVGYKTVQSFSVDNAGPELNNINNAQWTTVTGHYDVAVSEGTTLGMIQVHGNSTGYLSSGHGTFAIDNVTVDISPIPEPTSLSLIAIGCAGSLVLRKHSNLH